MGLNAGEENSVRIGLIRPRALPHFFRQDHPGATSLGAVLFKSCRKLLTTILWHDTLVIGVFCSTTILWMKEKIEHEH